ncbi:MAG: DUF362 domain-containing protein [Candidatus Stygibacter australis]|nr:DUF362 domain-containing protein [Candidatus Stygibacter australis]MDP8323099.1 DUF362 domain-containing protein [Candidatus Stygibacter australis]
MAIVYYTKEINAESVWKIYQKVSEPIYGKIGIKLHFGERGNMNYLDPQLLHILAKELKASLVETNVLYLGPRRETASHLEVAEEHGFNFAPIDILDAEGEYTLPFMDAKHFKEVRLPSGIDRYDSFIIYSHFKGHIMSGFGGAIKNVGMGMASIPGKMAQHASTIPIVNDSSCVVCGLCVKECPGKAITLEPVKISKELCIGCGKCIGVCPQRLFSIPWGSTSLKVFQERVVDYARMISTGRKMIYINVIDKVSRLCDCDMGAPPPFAEKIGIVASTDMLAADKASLDLVNDHMKEKDTFARYSGVSGNHQLEYALETGLGSIEYQLIEIE